ATVVVARGLLELYRLGALAPRKQADRPPEDGVEADLEEVRQLIGAGDYERAVERALKALGHTHALEAHELYRSAEAFLTRQMGQKVAALEGRLTFQPLPS